MAIKYNPLNPFGTNSLFANINKTNQQVNSMNLPMQPTQPKQDLKRQRYGNMMLALSDVLRGQNPSVGVMQRQALIDAERKEAERKADIEAFLENNPQYRQAYKLKNLLGISAPDRKIIKGNDGFNYYTDGTRVLPNVKAQPKSAGTMYQIVDGNNNDSFVGNISANDLAAGGFNKYEDAGIDTTAFKLTALPTGTAPASTSGDTEYDTLKGRFMATNTLINNLGGLADQYYNNPKSALAIGNASQFVDSVIQNLDAAGEMLSGEDYINVKKSGYTTIEGNDFSTEIKNVSQATGVSESRVRDLAYLFAAARGQTGRGLSDKDYENALKIVSGGVGAEGKIMVLEDVAGRLSEEVRGDLDFIVRNLPEGSNIDRYTRLRGSLPTFVNPYSININSIIPSNDADEVERLLRIYGG